MARAERCVLLVESTSFQPTSKTFNFVSKATGVFFAAPMSNPRILGCGRPTAQEIRAV